MYYACAIEYRFSLGQFLFCFQYVWASIPHNALDVIGIPYIFSCVWERLFVGVNIQLWYQLGVFFSFFPVLKQHHSSTVNIGGKKDNSLQSTAHVAHVAMCVLPTELVCTYNVLLIHSHCTYNSTSSTAVFEYCKGSVRHILASMSSAVGVGSCLKKYGGLCREQHVLLERQFSPSHRVSLEWSTVRCLLPSHGSFTPDSQK